MLVRDESSGNRPRFTTAYRPIPSIAAPSWGWLLKILPDEDNTLSSTCEAGGLSCGLELLETNTKRPKSAYTCAPLVTYPAGEDGAALDAPQKSGQHGIVRLVAIV